jgi:hypothetical protein
MLPNCKIIKTKRAHNILAHKLAQLAKTSASGNIWVPPLPTAISMLAVKYSVNGSQMNVWALLSLKKMFRAAPGSIDTRLFKEKRGNRGKINNYLHVSSVIFPVWLSWPKTLAGVVGLCKLDIIINYPYPGPAMID